MPGTIDEEMEWVRSLITGAVMPDDVPIWADGTRPDAEELRTLDTLLRYEIRCRVEGLIAAAQRPAQRKAMRCLRRFLTPPQRRQLTQSGHFDVRARSGTVYRFWPRAGNRGRGGASVGVVERHGRRLYHVTAFCIHPDLRHGLPPADVTLSQLLLLSVDEAEFLATANATDRRSEQLWNGDWLRRLRRAREERAREREMVAT